MGETVISTETESPEAEAHAERASESADHAERESDRIDETAEHIEELREETEAHAESANAAAVVALDSVSSVDAAVEETREARTENQQILHELSTLPERIAAAIHSHKPEAEPPAAHEESGPGQAEITASDPVPTNSHWYFRNIGSPFKKG